MKLTKGFTLVELLVVIAIIAILLSILMPSLRAAREQARLVIGKSRQSQNGLANIMYADGNGGKTINEVWIDSNGKVHTGTATDMTYLYPNIGFAKLFDTGIIDKSRKSILIFYCTLIPKNNPRCADFINPDIRPGEVGYGMTNVERIMAPIWSFAHVPLSIQTRGKWTSGVIPPRNDPQTLLGTPGKWGFDVASDSRKSYIADTWAGYHNGKGVAWYLDGHVETWDSRVLMTRDWYDDIYAIFWNQSPSYSYNSREIQWNYGHCFNWLDKSKKYYTKKKE